MNNYKIYEVAKNESLEIEINYIEEFLLDYIKSNTIKKIASDDLESIEELVLNNDKDKYLLIDGHTVYKWMLTNHKDIANKYIGISPEACKVDDVFNNMMKVYYEWLSEEILKKVS